MGKENACADRSDENGSRATIKQVPKTALGRDLRRTVDERLCEFGAHGRWTEHFAELIQDVTDKLSLGHELYGDAGFDSHSAKSMREVTQELVDVFGWTILGYCRVKNLIRRLEEYEKNHR